MSKVISFRLNRNNLREAQALEVLGAWSAEGYSIRYILTEALLKLSDFNPEHTAAMLNEAKMTLSQVSQLLELFGNDDLIRIEKRVGYPSNAGLNDNFVASVKKSVKLGIKLG
jgi:hypothetical protein